MPSASTCRINQVLKVIGDRWSLGIIHLLGASPHRTLELHGALTGLSTKTLAERLKRLEKYGLITRVSYPESPPRVEYSLTDKGLGLLPALEALSGAADAWGPVDGGPLSVISCRACRHIRPEAADRARVQAMPEAGPARHDSDPRPPQPAEKQRPRKKTDVTLL